MAPPSPRKLGRPTLLTDEVRERIVSAVAGGAYFDDAAQFAGITERTFYNWIRRGKDAQEIMEAGGEIPDSEIPFLQFLQEVERARANAVMRNLTLIQTAASNGSWQAAAWYLERTNPRKWGRHETYEVTGLEGMPAQPASSARDSLREKFQAAQRVALERLGSPSEDLEIIDAEIEEKE